MPLEITPEPSPEERQALLSGLERLLGGGEPERLPAAYRSAWRLAAVLEATGRDSAAARFGTTIPARP